MSVVEEIPDFELRRHIREHYEKLEATREEDLTVADRLTKQAFDQRMVIHIGAVTLESRVPLTIELDRLLKLRTEIERTAREGDADGQERAITAIYDILSGLICDDSITPEFFQSGMFSTEDIWGILDEIMESISERVIQAKSFRTKARRERVVSTMRSIREAST